MNKTIVLGNEGIKALKNSLLAINTQLENTIDACEREIAEYGANALSELAPISAKYDGNYSGSVSFNPTENGYEVSYEGDQVAYIEFGTGITGEGYYPDSDILNQANWIYDINDHGLGGWVYKDHRTGEEFHSVGMVGEKPVYRAYRKTEQELPNIVKRVLNEKFN